MSYCSSCGSSLPEGQSICSMCYGDPGYGRDGLYEKWLEDQEWLREQEHNYTPEEAFSANMDDPDIPF